MVHFSRSKDTLAGAPSVGTLDTSSLQGVGGGGPPGGRRSTLCSTPTSLEWDFRESTMSLQDKEARGWGGTFDGC